MISPAVGCVGQNVVFQTCHAVLLAAVAVPEIIAVAAVAVSGILHRVEKLVLVVQYIKSKIESNFNSEFSNKCILSLRKRIIRVIKSMIRKKSKRRVEYT